MGNSVLIERYLIDSLPITYKEDKDKYELQTSLPDGTLPSP